jgi:nicotinamidase-related amidase
VSSAVRNLADESFNVVVVEDCCAAATMELHEKELEIINMIYCHVASLEEVMEFLAGADRQSQLEEASCHRVRASEGSLQQA